MSGAPALLIYQGGAGEAFARLTLNPDETVDVTQHGRTITLAPEVYAHPGIDAFGGWQQTAFLALRGDLEGYQVGPAGRRLAQLHAARVGAIGRSGAARLHADLAAQGLGRAARLDLARRLTGRAVLSLAVLSPQEAAQLRLAAQVPQAS